MRSSLFRRTSQLFHKRFATSSSSTSEPSVLEADAGAFATRVHHSLSVGLGLGLPLYLCLPESWTVSHTFTGLGVATATAGHSWIAMNYVLTDYVPKISKAALGPARIVNFAASSLLLLGLAAVELGNTGGIKRVILGLWNPDKKE